MAKPKSKNKKVESGADKSKHSMKIVPSATCEVCKQQCERGLRYLERMSQPGAVGFGVPCILTKGKA